MEIPTYSVFLRWFLVALCLVVILFLIVPPASAEILRLDQGAQVYPGQIVDISSVVGWTVSGDYYLAYYGLSGSELDPQYIIKLPGKSRTGDVPTQYQFYIDPSIFGQRLGPWYQFYGNTSTTEHGNLLAFRVVPEFVYNKPVENITAAVTPIPTPEIVLPIVPPKKFDADFEVAYGDLFTLNVTASAEPHIAWLFGRVDGYYNRTFPTARITFTADEIQNLETGTYTLIIQSAGKNGIFEVGYSKTVDTGVTTEQLTSPWLAVKPVNVFGMNPRLVCTEYRKLLLTSDDLIIEYKLEVTNPEIDMVSVDETYAEGSDMLDIRGYTNVAKGTEVTFVMDEDKQNAKFVGLNTFVETVKEDNPHYWRYFKILIPLDYETIPVGMHTITASTPFGGTQTIPYYVYDIPEGQVKPNDTIKYVAGNIFVPTPTPIIVTEYVTQVVTQEILIPVTPTDEQIRAHQKKVQEEITRVTIMNGITIALSGIVAVGCVWYGWSVLKRARLR